VAARAAAAAELIRRPSKYALTPWVHFKFFRAPPPSASST
jgi:hypothetical protein